MSQGARANWTPFQFACCPPGWVLFIHLQSLFSFDRWRRLERKLTIALTGPLLDYRNLKSPSWSRWSPLTAAWLLSAETCDTIGRVRKQVMSLIISISKNQTNITQCLNSWTQGYGPGLFCLRLPALCLIIMTGKVFLYSQLAYSKPCIYPHHINPTNESVWIEQGHYIKFTQMLQRHLLGVCQQPQLKQSRAWMHVMETVCEGTSGIWSVWMCGLYVP